MRSITRMGDEHFDPQDIAAEIYRRTEPKPKTAQFGMPARLGSQPTLEEINKPPKEQPKRKRPAKAKRDLKVEDAHTKDLQTRGIT